MIYLDLKKVGWLKFKDVVKDHARRREDEESADTSVAGVNVSTIYIYIYHVGLLCTCLLCSEVMLE